MSSSEATPETAPAPAPVADPAPAAQDAGAEKKKQQNPKKQQQPHQQQKGKGKGGKGNAEGKEGASKEGKAKAKKASDFPSPAFWADRLALWDQYKNEWLAKQVKEEKPIKVTLPDGRSIDATAFKTTPYEIAKSISRNLANDTVVAKVNGKLYDVLRPFEEDSSLELITFNSDEGKHVFWHSSAHILGQALERRFGCNLTVGPALQEGFYYDAGMPNGETITTDDLQDIKVLIDDVVSQKQPFERVPLTKEQALSIFKYNPFKVEIINQISGNDLITAYRCGPFVDLCRGPHLPSTEKAKGFLLTKNSSVYWKGKEENPVLQRVYGISFPDKQQLTEWEKFQAEAAKRDHRNIGKDQELFFFHPLSPGSCFFLPHGARIYNKLVEFIRNEYWKRGFQEVVTPNVYNHDLWYTSGHFPHYLENMFSFECENQQFALKPMNCPGHCLMFGHRTRSYRELPLRFADFGVLHRNERSGALTGLTRVRRFQQDDAHIFCPEDHIKTEIDGCLRFMEHVYGIFGYDFTLELSTRPEKFLGEIEVWNRAEKALEEALNGFGRPWKINPGDGAFYGPKIDIHIFDAIKRSHQCATIQLDFQLPQRFKLEYQSDQEAVTKRPVIIHRAILGSVERMIAILIEHTGGKWPFWLSPRQVIVIPITNALDDYAESIYKKIHEAKYYVDVDLSDKNLNRKVREAQLAQYNFILVVGKEEQTNGTVNVRERDNNTHFVVTLDELFNRFSDLIKNYK